MRAEAVAMKEDFTIDECAKMGKMSAKTIRREIRDGNLKAAPIRGCIRIAEEEWQRYRNKCQSENTAVGMKFEFSLPGSALAKLLGIAKTPSSLNESSGQGSSVVSLAERRNTRSRKLSPAG